MTRTASAGAITLALVLSAAPPAQARRIVRAPADFRFVLHFWVADVYDSGPGAWLADRVCMPPDTVAIALPPARRDTIWTELADMRFFDLPPSLQDCREGAPQPSLAEHWSLSVTANGREHAVRWGCDLDGRERRVPLLCRSILHWLMDTPQYRHEKEKPPPCLYQ